MKGLETGWTIPPTLMLRMISISQETKAAVIDRILDDCYEIKFNGIAKMFTSRLVVKESFRVLPTEWWRNLREKRVADLAMQRFALIMHESKVPFYAVDFHTSEWRFELQFDASSPKHRAVYIIYVCRDEWGTDSRQNQVRCDIQLCAKGLDAKIIRRVKMIDGALYSLLNDCVEWAQAQPEVECTRVEGGAIHEADRN